VDHQGVPNAVLVMERDAVAEMYHDKSVAEQNSIDRAWDILMEPRFHKLRRAIYSTKSEFVHFRQLFVNSVLATDIMDKDMIALRNKRWDAAFASDAEQQSRLAINRKATIVIEHLIQASDVAHTMQHWQVYSKWNARLFEEMYKAYVDGRVKVDPSATWYSGEIGFFDFYVIPLAKKLKECGVFGVSSDEYLNYARQNKKEWEARGQQMCAAMIKAVHLKHAARHAVQVSRMPNTS
jgi:3'5'-cyclic nucleotide phosphodiesterase